jgi:quercetin 2,3-dioxygenase
MSHPVTNASHRAGHDENIMMTIRRANERGHANHGWLDTWHTFSFAGYFDPAHMGFRSLRVINDDTVAPGAGFGTHPHRDMEIITYVLSGAVQHKDSMGNGRVIKPGEFQYMAAGTGIQHSEFNPSPTEPGHFLQIWILPDRKGVKPRYEEKTLTRTKAGELHLVASKSGRDNSIAINQDANVYVARLREGDSIRHVLKPQRQAWVHVAEGELDLNGETLRAGDGAALVDEKQVTLAGKGPAQVLLFDLN